MRQCHIKQLAHCFWHTMIAIIIFLMSTSWLVLLSSLKNDLSSNALDPKTQYSYRWTAYSCLSIVVTEYRIKGIIFSQMFGARRCKLSSFILFLLTYMSKREAGEVYFYLPLYDGKRCYFIKITIQTENLV